MRTMAADGVLLQLIIFCTGFTVVQPLSKTVTANVEEFLIAFVNFAKPNCTLFQRCAAAAENGAATNDDDDDTFIIVVNVVPSLLPSFVFIVFFLRFVCMWSDIYTLQFSVITLLLHFHCQEQTFLGHKPQIGSKSSSNNMHTK